MSARRPPEISLAIRVFETLDPDMPARIRYISSTERCHWLRLFGPASVTSRHLANYNDTCTFRQALRAAYRTAISAAQILVSPNFSSSLMCESACHTILWRRLDLTSKCFLFTSFCIVKSNTSVGVSCFVTVNHVTAGLFGIDRARPILFCSLSGQRPLELIHTLYSIVRKICPLFFW